MSTYPSTKDTFNVITTANFMDEAGYVLHERLNTHGSAVVAIEDVLGTTAATNTMTDFSTGEKAVARNTGGTITDPIKGINGPGNAKVVELENAIGTNVNHLTLVSSVADNPVSIKAEGSDETIDMVLRVKTASDNYATFNFTDQDDNSIIAFDTDGDITGSAILDEDTMASDSATKLATQQSIKAMHDTGWSAITETLTYASATTITVAAGAVSRYQKGDKLKLTQTTTKYFSIITVADTLLTVTGGTDYTVANAAITTPQLSRIENPFGWPEWFAYTPSFVGSTTNPSIGNGSVLGRFKIEGKEVSVMARVTMGSSTTYGSGFLSVTMPVTPFADPSPHNQMTLPMYAFDISALLAHTGIISGNQTRVYFVGGRLQPTVPFTFADGDELLINGSYLY
jgi:hypothetical protein